VVTIGRYRVVRELGHGGMGTVFLAHDPSLERDVALKLLHRDSQSGLREEAKALAALSHPNIVTIFEIGAHEGQDFITMEYLPGRSLRQALQEHASRDLLVAICAKIALALDAAHRAGILHRDIKPENVVDNDAGGVKVVDFGIARRLDEARTREHPRAVSASEVIATLRSTLPPGTLRWGPDTEVSAGTETAFGTPAYMAPEVLVGEVSTAASDVYSLGVVLYECLSGRRPHDGSTLVEVIAQVIDSDPPLLADPLGELVARMLSRDPNQRPSLAVIAAALGRPTTVAPAPPSPTVTPPAPPARPAPRRWPLVVIAACAAGGLGLAGWTLLHGDGGPTAAHVAPPPAPAPVTATLAVSPLTVDIPTYGREPPQPALVTDVLAKLLAEIDGAKLTAIVVDPHATTIPTSYLVSGSIVESHATLRGTLELVDGATHRHVTTVTATRPSPRLAPLLDDLTRGLATAVAPAARLDSLPNHIREQTFYRLGAVLYEQGQFTDARPYFEQAVDADPTSFESWYALAAVLAWMDAPEPTVLAASDEAVRLAPRGPKGELVRGVSRFLHGDFAEARAALEPIEHATQWSFADQRELLYYLGEANWHDGRHAVAFAYFKRTLELDPKFRPATVHAWEYTVARRDAEHATYYIGAAGENMQWLQFALGDYKTLAVTGSPVFKLQAQLVTGQTPSPELEPTGDDVDARTYRIARAAEVGDMTRARTEFAALWTMVSAQPAEQLGGMFYALESLGEVLVAADMAPEARQLLTLLAAQSTDHAVRGYHRFSILVAPLLGDPSLIPTDHLTEREGKLADASRAELAGKRAEAVAILTDVVGDPTFFWDYPERAALIRNLRALHKTKEAAAVCTATLSPALYRTAYLVLRHTCGR